MTTATRRLLLNLPVLVLVTLGIALAVTLTYAAGSSSVDPCKDTVAGCFGGNGGSSTFEPTETETSTTTATVTPTVTQTGTATATPTSTPTFTPEPSDFVYKCYDVKVFDQLDRMFVFLDDQFGSKTSEVRGLQHFCTTATKGVEPDVIQLVDHLACYKIKDEPDNDEIEVEISDQFGELTLIVQKAAMLCVEADKQLDEQGASGLQISNGDFKCYEVRVKPQTPLFQRRSITLTDQYGTRDTDVRRPYRLCNPADKNGGKGGGAGQVAQDYLICYQIRDEKDDMPFQRHVEIIGDQFDKRTVEVREATRVCLSGDKSSLEL